MDANSPEVLLRAHFKAYSEIATDFLYSNLNSGDYIGQKLRENSFDPKGKGTSTMLDDLVKTL